ncbi:tyrosine-type recombinase/integrase [Aromatoleum evansii]|uniref:Tyrosine-type recombinase/integrase n=1 Tax=Aromatoleum evansii TaxID=59406 RepID=A0ABZ1ASA8_AROEV|nr:tyrosine-type recombinase/integrase [Aromatoleum evansii]
MREAIAPKPPSFASLVQQFFTEYLVAQRAVSPRTVACYRDALMLFLDFSSRRLKKAPTSLQLNDIQPDLILAFLDHLERERHNAVRSRNLRLTALRAFLKFAGRRDVASLHVVERALAVPMKRFERPMLGFLTREEMLAVLGQPGDTWTSQRDHLLLAMLYNTGARVSEIIGVHVADVVLDGGACVHLHGKGRKQRSVPLWHTTVAEVRAWLRLNPTLRGEAPLLPNRDGQQPMSRSNVVQRLALAVARAAAHVPGILNKRVSPHTLRHTTAMHLLQSGVPFNVIALWLGHESPTTTHRYVEADLAMKEKALARLEAPDTTLHRFKATDSLMQFLEAL